MIEEVETDDLVCALQHPLDTASTRHNNMNHFHNHVYCIAVLRSLQVTHRKVDL